MHATSCGSAEAKGSNSSQWVVERTDRLLGWLETGIQISLMWFGVATAIEALPIHVSGSLRRVILSQIGSQYLKATLKFETTDRILLLPSLQFSSNLA